MTDEGKARYGTYFPNVVTPDHNWYKELLFSNLEISSRESSYSSSTEQATNVVPIFDTNATEEGAPDKDNSNLALLVSETMPSSVPLKGKLGKMLGNIIPIRSPKITDVRAFCREVSNKLATIPCTWTKGGMAHLCEETVLYLLRIGKTSGSKPALPDLLELPEEPTAIQIKTYEILSH